MREKGITSAIHGLDDRQPVGTLPRSQSMAASAEEPPPDSKHPWRECTTSDYGLCCPSVFSSALGLCFVKSLSPRYSKEGLYVS